MRRLLALFLATVVLATRVHPQGAVDGVEARVVSLANEVRVHNGLPALTSDPYLGRAARLHSEEMAGLNFFDHESPTVGRRFPWDRVNLVGADADTISENIYLVEGSGLDAVAAMAVRAWVDSPAHRQNLLDQVVSCIGAGVATHGNKIYVTLVFSSPVTVRR